jgi:hypothetical protein
VKACTLTSEGRAVQHERFDAVRGHVSGVERSPTTLTARFGPDTDEALLGELIATERECCSFLDIDYSERVLRIGSDDPRDLEPFAELLGGGL